MLIICYTFPPSTGIGGRRWAKFAKYLHEDNVELEVIAARNDTKEGSDWKKDIDSYKHKITYLKSGYSEILSKYPKTFYGKIAYRLALLKAKIKQPGNYYDKSIFWKHELLKTVESKILKGYNNVIVSCAPFTSAYYLLELKSKYKHVNFIVDFRDPWTTNQTSYGFSELSLKRQKFEKEKELKVVKSYDYIITVADEMTSYFKQIALSDENRFLTINNGFDPEDYKIENAAGVTKAKKIRFVFIGTFYRKATHHLTRLVEVLDELCKITDLKSEICFEFYGDLPSLLYTLDHPLIKSYGMIPHNTAIDKIREASICMLFLTDDLNYSFSTKFYEYIAQKKTIAVFTKRGATSDYIEKNNLGYVLSHDDMKEKLEQILADFRLDKLVNNPVFDIHEYNVKNISRTIEDLLI